MYAKPANQSRITLLIFSAITLIFVADLLLPGFTVVPVLYVVPVLMTMFHKSRRLPVLTAILVTFLSTQTLITDGIDFVHQINLVISITGIWVAYYFLSIFNEAYAEESKDRERLQALFMFATEGIIITDHKGLIRMINPVALRQFGYELKELSGRQIELLVPTRYTERHVKHRETFNRNPSPRPMGHGKKLFGKRKDGSEFPVEISLSNFSTAEGKFVIAFIIDISERSKAESLIQKEKELAQMYLDIAPVIFIVLSRTGAVNLINQNGCVLLGISEAEILNRNWFETFIKDADRETAINSFNRLFEQKTDTPFSFEYTIRTGKGTERLISWKYSFIRDERGNILSILFSGEDITDRKTQEEELEKVNRELKQYSDQITKLNAELEGRVKDRTEELAKTISKLEITNEDLAVEINERKEAEKQLTQKREELRIALEKEKELGELKSRFVTMASHEFRTPLSTILSSASLIEKYTGNEQEDKRTKHISRIKSSVYNLTTILNDFLSLGKLEEGKIICSPSEFNIESLSSEVMNDLKELAKSNQNISYEHRGDNRNVILDKNLVRNISTNLLSNALKYSDPGTEVEFRTSLSGDKLIIRVSDQGIGIPAEEQHHIFERFFRAHNASNIQGTGLGLNIVKKYAELMQGEISFESSPGKGTTFTVELPAVLQLNS